MRKPLTRILALALVRQQLWVGCAVAAIAQALTPGTASTQTKTGWDPFFRPTGQLLCRRLPTTALDSSAYLFEFDEEVPGTRRSSIVGFDSAGSPVRLLMLLSGENIDVKGASQGFLIGYVPIPDGSHVRYLRPPDSTAQGSDTSQTRQITGTMLGPLTESELAKSKALTTWFWQHRCSSRDKPTD